MNPTIILTTGKSIFHKYVKVTLCYQGKMTITMFMHKTGQGESIARQLFATIPQEMNVLYEDTPITSQKLGEIMEMRFAVHKSFNYSFSLNHSLNHSLKS